MYTHLRAYIQRTHRPSHTLLHAQRNGSTLCTSTKSHTSFVSSDGKMFIVRFGIFGSETAGCDFGARLAC